MCICTCTRVYICMCSSRVSSLFHHLQAASDKSFRPLQKGLTGSWVPRSWQGRGPACCAGGQSTRMGWSCPGPQPPLRSGIPAHHLREPQSRTAPGPTALAAGGKHREVLLSWGRPSCFLSHGHTEEDLQALVPRQSSL